MIIDIVILLAVSFGLGFFLPSPFVDARPTPGYRVFCGFCLKMVLIYVGIVLLRLGFDITLAVLLILAAIGLSIGVLRMRIESQIHEILSHPFVLLPLLILSIRLGYGVVEFSPYGDDTYVNWLSHSKQIWLINDFWSDAVQSSGKGYPPGWHMMISLTSSLWGKYSDNHAIAVPAVLHIALVCIIFDIAVIWWRDELNNSSQSAKITGYAFILFALAVEGSWRLIPTLILPEAPLFLTSIGLVGIGFLFWFQGSRFYPLAASVGIALSAHFLIKDQGLALIPTAVLLILGASIFQSPKALNIRQSIIGLLLALLPVLVFITSWKTLGPDSPKCAADTLNMFSKGIEKFFTSNSTKTLAVDLSSGFWMYFTTYKLPLSILATAGLIGAAFFDKVRWISYSVATYIVFYLGAVFWAYLSCPDGFNSYLSSLQRYLQLPIRMFHYVGLMLFAYTCVQILLRHRQQNFNHLIFVVTAIATLGLGVYQGYAVRSSFDIISKPPIGIRMSRHITEIPADITRIKKIALERGLENPRILMAYVFWSDFPFLVALHHSYPTYRNKLPKNGMLSQLNLISSRFKNGSETLPVVASSIKQTEVADIIWSIDHSHSLAKRISGLVSDKNCLNDLSAYYLVRTNNKTFSCIPRK